MRQTVDLMPDLHLKTNLTALLLAAFALACTGPDDDADAATTPVDSVASDTVTVTDTDPVTDTGPVTDTVIEPDTATEPDTVTQPDTVTAPDTVTVTDAVIEPDTVTAPDTASDTASAPDTADAGGKFCPGPTKPKTTDNIPVVPKPDTSTCKWKDPKMFKGAKPPPPTLLVELGHVDNAGAFHTYKDGDWAALDHGVQGGFHLTAAVRLKLPGVTLPKIKVQFEPELFSGCELQGFGNAPTVYPELTDSGWYQKGSKLTPGIQVRFGVPGKSLKSDVSFGFCNEWFDLRAAVRDVATGQWGKVSVKLRTYDTKAGIKP